MRKLVAAALAVSVLAPIGAVAHMTPQLIAEWNDVFPNGIPREFSDWASGVMSPHGIPCCNIADGHPTTWEKRPGNPNYWIQIQGEWREVPPEAVVKNARNPTGEAIVWYAKQGENTYYIRCFVEGSGS